MTSLAQILFWFMTGKKPTQAQFSATFQSFWHKLEQIPISAINGLSNILNSKAEKSQLDGHFNDVNAHAALFQLMQSISEKGEANGYVPLDELTKIASQYLNIIDDLVTGGSSSLLSAEQGKVLQGRIDGIMEVLESDDVNLDTVQEIVDAIKEVETSLETILVNDLTTGGVTKALTAEMGKSLKALIDALAAAKFDTANISNDIEVDKASTTKVPSAKQVYDFASGAKVPLAAFLDIVNGNDATAKLESSVKSFKTMAALVNALPVTIGETYTIYITGGTVPITRRMPFRNLKFVAYTNTTLDFTTCKESDGVTEAIDVLSNGTDGSVWTFENANISIVSNYVGRKSFFFGDINNNRKAITMVGTLNIVDWKSTSIDTLDHGFGLGVNSNLKIKTLKDSTQARSNIGFLRDNIYLEVDNFIIARNNRFSYGYQQYGVNTSTVKINNITETAVVASYTFRIVGGRLIFGNIDVTGSIEPQAQYLSFNNTTLSNKVTSFNIGFTSYITGTLTSNIYLSASWYLPNGQVYEDFKGKIKELFGVTKTKFINCNLELNGGLLKKYSATAINDLVYFEGFNTITNLLPDSDLVIDGGYTTDMFHTIDIKGTVTSNMKSYGKFATTVQNSATFKEKLNEIVIRSKRDLVGRVLDSLTTYIIDGKITLLSGEFIEIPAGGLTITGYGFDVSQINKNVAGQSIFTSPVGGSGNLVTKDMQYTSGLGSVLNIQDSDGSHAIEMNDVNFIGCSSIGKIKGYRQFTGTTCGIYSCNDGIQVSGNWSGFKLTNSNVLNFTSGATLIKKDVDTLFSNRLYLDINFSCQTGAVLSDVIESNFVSNGLFQINNSVATYAGSRDASNTPLLIPNMSFNDPKSRFTNNLGISESAVNFQDIKSPDGTIWRLTVNNAGDVLAASV